MDDENLMPITSNRFTVNTKNSLFLGSGKNKKYRKMNDLRKSQLT